MTYQEKKAQIAEAASAALARGDQEEYERLKKEFPANPDVIMGLKKIFGPEPIFASGVNLSEVEAQYGPEWHK